MKIPLIFRIYKKDQIHMVKQFIEDDRIVIGHGGGVEINLEAEDVSAIHCLVEKRGSQYHLCDLGSAQGTYKNGQPVLDEPIQSGDGFHVGPFQIQFLIGNQKASVTPPISNAVPATGFSAGAKSAVAVAAAKTATAVTVSSAAKKSKKTFAPQSEFSDLRDYLKVGVGKKVEVIVSWQERILNTYHFSLDGVKTLGTDIQVPEGSSPKNWKVLDLNSGVVIHATPEMKMELLRDGELSEITGGQHKLNQSEACFISLVNGMQIVIRFAPKAPPLIFASPLILGSSEFTGILAALIIAVLTSLLVSVNKPKPTEVIEEEPERLAQVIFANPPLNPIENRGTPSAPPVEKKAETVQKAPEPEELKKAILLDDKRESQIYGDPAKPQSKAQIAQQSSGTASEVKPKDPQLKTKMFTSTKQGGAVKTGNVTGANTQSFQPDPNNSGLLAAFGEGGARSKLDQVYSGTGELIGTAEKAQGVSGFNADRGGDDLGSQLKDTGAGGSGTATQGIAGIGTKGRGTGMSGYGSGTGFGDKDSVQIAAGGSEEMFTGSIDKEAVRRAVRSALPQFKACYEREYRVNTKLEGKVVITWEIHEQGIAKNARVIRERSTINNSVVEECVRTRMLGLRFPEPPVGTAAEVTYPFVFQGQKL